MRQQTIIVVGERGGGKTRKICCFGVRTQDHYFSKMITDSLNTVSHRLINCLELIAYTNLGKLGRLKYTIDIWLALLAPSSNIQYCEFK